MMADDEYDYLFKLVLIGDSGVGKSNLLSRFTVCMKAVRYNLCVASHSSPTERFAPHRAMNSIWNQKVPLVLSLPPRIL
jgi:ABC-type lipoprotein export system ATPase subunit